MTTRRQTMLHNSRTSLALSLLAALFPLATSAQIELGGRPASELGRLTAAVPTLELPSVDGRALRAAREREPGEALRFGELVPVRLGLHDGGVWEELADGSRVWRARIHSDGAFSLSLIFERFQLPPEGELFVYDDDKTTVRGAYTYHNHNPDGRFAIQPIAGDVVNLEYREPAGTDPSGVIELQGVVHDYMDVLGRLEAGACNVDTACAPQLELQTRATVQVLAGAVFCSGVLLNNTAEDGTQLILTSEHCGDMTNGVFVFRFERSTCGGGTAISTQTVNGSTVLASDATIDFQLGRITKMIPDSYEPYLAGWDNSGVIPSMTYAIHHPNGDEKAVCVDLDPPTKFAGRRWRVLEWDVGTTEIGSSGCGLFDPADRVIGCLEGGFASCSNPVDDRFIRMDVMWPSLAPFLDPLGSGATTLDGYDPLTQPVQPLSGLGTIPSGIPVLQPGIGKDVQIKGTGFDGQTLLALEGVPIGTGRVNWINSQTLEVDMPQVPAVGTYTLTITKGTETVDMPITFVANAEPTLQVGNGVAGNPALFNVSWILAGQPGDLLYVTFSPSNLPSIHPAWMLEYGNQFTEVVFLGMYVIPPTGLVGISSPTTGYGGTDIWSTATLLNGVFPAPQSNLQQFRVVL